jgi:hypothetical protein
VSRSTDMIKTVTLYLIPPRRVDTGCNSVDFYRSKQRDTKPGSLMSGPGGGRRKLRGNTGGV